MIPTTCAARRRFVLAMSAAAASFGLPRPLHAAGRTADHTQDWTWLLGNWNVSHRRLKQRLAGSDDWELFGGKSALWLAMGGLGTIDDNLLELPAGVYRGLTVRTYDAASDSWAIWWLDGRAPTRLDAPVRGRFADGIGTFVGADTFEGRPILMRFRWLDLLSARPNWEQAFSADDGKTWEVNWTNAFTRTAAEATPLPLLDTRPHDFDFLVGRWQVAHRRLRRRLAGCTDWDEFDGTLVNRPVLGGHGNVGDNLMNFPGGAFRGIGLRAFDAGSGEWLSWWFDGRSPATPGTPLRGRFADGVGIFHGEEVVDGRRQRTRVRWSAITPRSARWEQASSGDGGVHWETNWISEFTRSA